MGLSQGFPCLRRRDSRTLLQKPLHHHGRNKRHHAVSFLKSPGRPGRKANPNRTKRLKFDDFMAGAMPTAAEEGGGHGARVGGGPDRRALLSGSGCHGLEAGELPLYLLLRVKCGAIPRHDCLLRQGLLLDQFLNRQQGEGGGHNGKD